MISENVEINYSGVQNIGGYSQNDEYGAYHIQKILDLKWVDVDAIKKANFKIAIDCVNSSGGLYIPRLLEALGVDQVVELYTEPTGEFPHNPEPLAENLENLSRTVTDEKCDLGLAVDPDVDRLAFVSEDGSMFGEEYTLVAVADYILGEAGGGNTVSNLSSSRALRDVTQKHGGKYSASAVGEVNVVELMKETDATIGGEGNGGIIFPELHYGRDALVGIALFLTHLAKSGKSCKELRETYPHYEMLKQKVQLTPETDVDKILNQVEEKFVNEELNTTDGVKIDFEDGWVHLRKSNTEPIIRVYSEANTTERASELAEMLMKEIRQIAG
jgi:phosphomannomutase